MADQATKKKGLRKKIRKGKGKYARYRTANSEFLHSLKHVLQSNGIKEAEAFCKRMDMSSAYLKRAVASKQPHTQQNRVEVCLKDNGEGMAKTRLEYAHPASTVFYG
jgi:hypothetical protein